MSHVFVPSIVRKHRRCTTEGCTITALHFPVVEFGDGAPMALETPFQYCPACAEKFKTPQDLPMKLVKEAMIVAKQQGLALPDMATARINWYPLIILEDFPEGTKPYDPSRHD